MPIFLDDMDRAFLLARLAALLEGGGTRCHAWVLMPNHIHLLLQIGDEALQTLMARLLTSYAKHFNTLHGRKGHLFQNRYRSKPCSDEAYRLTLIRYIHLNPLRGEVVENIDELDRYPWCGHAWLMGNVRIPGQDPSNVLERFGKKTKLAREKYRLFLDEGEIGERDPGLWIPDGAPAEEAGLTASSSGKRDQKLWLGANPTAISLETLLERVSTRFSTFPGVLRKEGRNREIARIRWVFSSLAVNGLGFSGKEVGDFLGQSGSAISKGIRRGMKISATQPDLVQLLR